MYVNIAHLYEMGYFQGWKGFDAGQAAFNSLVAAGYKLYKFGDTDAGKSAYKWGIPNNKIMLYDVCRKVLGKDTPNYPQQIGDCVSFGAKNATEYVTCSQIFMGGERYQFKLLFPPYVYGTSRVQIGGQHDMSDGSSGAWAATAVMQFGMIPADTPGCPAYSGKVAKSWGFSGPPDDMLKVGKVHIVKSAAKINNWSDCLKALQSGKPCTVASNQGFAMEADSSGFHQPQGQWSHQMCIIGGCDDYGIILNNWGDCHGQLKDFDTGDPLPVGVLRVKSHVIERNMIQAGDETFAYSEYDGIPSTPLDSRLLDMVG